MNGLYLQLIIIYHRVSLGCFHSLRIRPARWNGEELCCDGVRDWPADNYTFIKVDAPPFELGSFSENNRIVFVWKVGHFYGSHLCF